MNKCPKCENWTLDYDEYFGRYRCVHPDCGWMPESTTEREIRLLRTDERPMPIGVSDIKELGLRVSVSYDRANDALLFDFGMEEASCDFPDSDGRIFWKVGNRSNSVIGFTIVGAKELGVREIKVDFAERKESIEKAVRGIPWGVSAGRATRFLIESVEVRTHSESPSHHSRAKGFQKAFSEAIDKFNAKFCPA